MKAIERSCTFEASSSEIAGAIDAFVSEDKRITCSWSGDRTKAALLIDRSTWWSKHFRAKSVVLHLDNNGVVEGECSDLALFMFSRQSDIDALHNLFNGIRDNLKK
jgi:hypothetical protein